MVGEYRHEARLDLGMTVRAEENAFLGLGTHRGEGSSLTGERELEPLLSGIGVMKVERPDMAVIAA